MSDLKERIGERQRNRSGAEAQPEFEVVRLLGEAALSLGKNLNRMHRTLDAFGNFEAPNGYSIGVRSQDPERLLRIDHRADSDHRYSMHGFDRQQLEAQEELWLRDSDFGGLTFRGKSMAFEHWTGGLLWYVYSRDLNTRVVHDTNTILTLQSDPEPEEIAPVHI